ncbi:ABC transporter permease [Gordonia sp. CPCC 205515]|uniref:FtsX-like permease family protein n=1 Tax=Gordonia sp. CPCC 205515 TaxID=3140791 RepID=UPI003AF3CD9A
MRAVRGWWTTFRRVHLAGLAADWRRTLLSAIGVAIGVTIVLGVLILKAELARPFDAFGPALTHAADTGTLEVSPIIDGRLPDDTVARIENDVPGARAVVPVVGALTPVSAATADSHGFFLLGGTCQIELLIGPFECAQRALGTRPAPGPGVPLAMPAAIAARYGVSPGDELRLPGLPPGATHLGSTFDELDLVAGINDGFVLIAPSPEIAARLLSAPGYATSAFVVPRTGAGIAADLTRSVTGIAEVGPPRPHAPAILENGTQTLDLVALAGIIVGVLVAVNTILLAVEDRRAVLGTVAAIGARPAGVFGAMLAEGSLVGLLGGLLAVPSGYLLGMFLVENFERSVLSGSGASVSAHFTATVIPLGAIVGIVCGVLAMLGPAVRLIRDGGLASMAVAGGVPRGRRVPLWPLLVGVALLVGAVLLLQVVARGVLPLAMGINGLTVWLFGVVLVTVWLAPRIAALLIGVFARGRADIGRLLGADIQRYALLFALSAALLTESAGLVIAAQSMQTLAADQIAEQQADRLPSALLLSAQAAFDQRDSAISDPVMPLVHEAAAGQPVSSRWRSTIGTGAATRLIFGVTPGDWYAAAMFEPTTDRARLWQGMRDGEVAVSQLAAGRLGVGVGDVVDLPTVNGNRQFRVAGVVAPQVANDAAVGDIVVVSDARARADWAAVRDQVAVNYPTSEAATAHRDDFLRLGAGLQVYDTQRWRSAATGISRFLQPFTIAGFLVMVAAGLSVLNVFILGLVQRRRERAVLRAIGTTAGQEQGVIAANAMILWVVIGVLAALGAIGLIYLWTLGSPVFYGITLHPAVPIGPVVSGMAVVGLILLVSAVYPMLHARRLEPADLLRVG